MEPSLKEKTAKGLMWGLLQGGSMQLFSAIIGIVLLRLLTPTDYGRIAVLLVFSTIASNLQESGFISALCNKRQPSHADYNAVFWFNIMVSISIYVLLFFLSPLIADFYNDPILTPLARVLFLGFLASAFGIVQRAYLYTNIKVKQTSLISLVSLIASGIIGIVMAYHGFAFWGLAVQSVLYIAFNTLLCWCVSPWRPSLHIDFRPAWQMFGFSSKLLLTNLFAQFNAHVFSVLLGRFYNTHVVGQYSNARKWNDMCVNTVNMMVANVVQPVLTQLVDDTPRYRQAFRKMLRFVCFITFPAMLGMGLISREFILITVGEKWLESAELLSLLTVYGCCHILTTLYSFMAISRGKSDVNMFCTIGISILVWGGLYLMHPYGLRSMIVYFICINWAWLLAWQYFAWRMFRMTVIDMAKDILPFLLLAAGVMVATWFITSGITNIYLCVTAKIIIAAILYAGLTYISGAQIMRESIGYLRKKKVND